MFPIPIISTYGNIAPGKPKIKKVIGGSNTATAMILYDNGELYSVGNNTYGQLGIGNTTNTSDYYRLCSTNVKMFDYGNGCSLIIKNDNTIWTIGHRYLYSTSATPYNTVQTEITSYFSTIDISQIKKIAVSHSSACILMNDGTLYGIGANSNGQLGRSGSVLSLTQISTGVIDIQTGYDTVAYMDTNNDVYISGYNNGYNLGNGNNTSRASFALLATSVQSFTLTLYNTSIQYMDGTVKSTGTGSLGSLGTGATSNATTLTNISPMYNLSYSPQGKYIKNAGAGGVFGFNLSTSRLYCTGLYNGTSRTLSYNLIQEISDFDGACSGTSFTYIWKGTDLYYCGVGTYNFNNPGVAASTFTKLTSGLPYYT